MTKPITYADAGVDIDKATTLVSAIGRITKQTNRPGVISARDVLEIEGVAVGVIRNLSAGLPPPASRARRVTHA